MKNLELVYLAVAYGMAGIMFYSTRHTTFPTVSHIALDHRLTRQVFFWGLTLAAILFAMLMYGWAIPHFSFGLGIKILVGILAICQILTGFFPVNEKRFGGAHTIFATSLGLCMFILIIALSASAALHPLARITDGGLAIGMVVLLATSVHVPRGEYLFHEKVFFAFWHIALFASIYLG
jgi:hypothetical protein